LTSSRARQGHLVRDLQHDLLTLLFSLSAIACSGNPSESQAPPPDAAPVPTPQAPRTVAESADEVTELNWDLRLRVLDEEISALGTDHPWAGHYATGVLTDTYDTLSIAPRAGYTKALVGSTSNVFESGGVRSDEHKITLDATFFHDESALPLMSPQVLWPVRWGECRFLLESDEMLRFCNGVNSGDPLNTFWFQGFYLRDRGSMPDVPPATRPELPLELGRYVFDEPLVARVVKVLSDRPGRVVLLDVGRIQGVFETMWLFGEAPIGGVFVAHEVLNRTCEASFGATDGGSTEPQVGQAVSSRRPAQTPSRD
jgi:hypothetical protein